MTEQLLNQLSSLLSDKSILQEIQATSSEAELKAYLAQKGTSLTDEELEEFIDLIQPEEEGELSDKELENVAGGTIWFNPRFPRLPLPLPWYHKKKKGKGGILSRL